MLTGWIVHLALRMQRLPEKPQRAEEEGQNKLGIWFLLLYVSQLSNPIRSHAKQTHIILLF